VSKAERLLQLYILLRSRRTAITAQAIGQAMAVSVRTVYRDMEALAQTGIPIVGESGVGYVLGKGIELPPLMFSKEEIQAITVGLHMVKAFTDPELAQAAQDSEHKIGAILTQSLKVFLDRQPYRVPLLKADHAQRVLHGQLRQACMQHHKVRLSYSDQDEQPSDRVVWPLGIIGWKGRWTLLAYCELRQDYRNFRFDRIAHMLSLEQAFTPTKQINMEHYLQHIGCDPATS
jgi:predicted DNA-binding transcriptional regulator YafY